MYRSILLTCLILLLTAPLLHADDLEIYNGKLVGVPPNVLVVFDNSGSMLNCPGTNNSADIKCNNNVKLKIVRDVLDTIFASEEAQKLRLGLMSFVKDSGGEGGRIHLPCGASSAALRQKVVDIAGAGGEGVDLSRLKGSGLLPYNGNTGTPLGEALAEAGLYFAGKGSAYLNRWPAESKYNPTERSTVDNVGNVAWYANSQYVSPINATCQKNYIVFLTDGEPNNDDPITNPYIAGMPNLTDLNRHFPNLRERSMLDDVASYLYNQDFSSLDGSQNIETVIISFDIDPDTVQKEEEKKAYFAALNLMKQAAKDGNGGQDGNFYTVNGIDTETIKNQLIKVFATIFQNILAEADSIYVAPVIPRNPENQIDTSDRVYMAFFKPQQGGRWIGNLKAYGLMDGILRDVNGQQATYSSGPNAGQIMATAKSYWSPSADGLTVEKGGAGGVLANRTTARNIYTYFDDVAGQRPTLTDASNRFTLPSDNPFNDLLTPTRLGLAATDTSGRNAILTNTLATLSVRQPDGTSVNWRFGDIVHSEPLVKPFEAAYQNGVVDPGETVKNYIFVGANDGMLHVLNAADGAEVWAFIPPGQLSRLKLLTADDQHDYFVDGSPVIEAVKKADNSLMQLLIFGERRGGKRYYALDVTNPDQPVWKYQIDDSLLGGGVATLGQSWSKPQLKKVRSGSQIKEVFLLTGGYDTNQDARSPAATDSSGRAIYTVLAEKGSVFGLNINAANWKDPANPAASPLTHSILDVTGFSKSSLGFMDRFYAGDLGGHLFAGRYQLCSNQACNNDYWEPTLLFSLVSSGFGQKIMTKPEVALEPGKECVYFGTGDRENPNEKTTVNAIYSVCNTWSDTQPKPLTINNLVDVTNNYVQEGSDQEKKAVTASLDSDYGWYLRLTNPGEKLISSPKLLNKKIYFTTFTPGTPPVNYDPCKVSFDFGVSRLYVVDYLTGAAVYDFTGDNKLTKEDRSIIIGTSIAGDPVLTTSGETTSLFYGSGGRFIGMPVETSPLIKRYFWRQLQ